MPDPCARPEIAARQDPLCGDTPARRRVRCVVRTVDLDQATTRPRRTTARGWAQHARGRRAGRRRRRRGRRARPARCRAGPARRGPARTPAASASSGGSPTCSCRASTSRADQAVRQHPAGVGAGVDRDAGLVGRRAAVASQRACRARMCAAYAGNFAPPCVGVRREVVDLHPGRHQRGAAAGPSRRCTSSVRPVPCSMQSMPAATSSATDCSPKQCAVTRAPSSWARLDRRRSDVGRPAGRQVAGVAVDPVADELDPAVAAGGLGLDLGDQVGRLDLGAVVADVALGPGDVPAGPDHPRQVVAVVHPARVDGYAGVAQQQRAASRSAMRLRLGGRLVDAAVRVEPDVAVRVDEAGQRRSRSSSTVCAPGTASWRSRPSSSTHRSRGSPSGRTTRAQVQRP